MRKAHRTARTAVAALLCVSLWTSAQAADDNAAIETVLSNDRYQRALPQEPGGLGDRSRGSSGGAGLPSLGNDGADGRTRSRPREANPDDATSRAAPPPAARPPARPPRSTDSPPNIERIGNVVLWTVLIVVGALFSVWLFRVSSGLRRRRAKTTSHSVERAKSPEPNEKASADPTPQATRILPVVPARPLTEWERLAQAGDYAAAVRAMLRYAVAVIRQRPGTAISADLTSREILRAIRAQRPIAEPLSTIVAAVEYVHFGGRSATVTDYERCSASLTQIDTREAAV